MSWFFFCLGFLLTLWILACWPLMRHPTLPRARKWLVCGLFFLLLVPGGWALYVWVGVPPMALL